MTGTIFRETLKRGSRPMLFWGIGMGLYAIVITAAVLDDATLQQMMQIVETIPGFIIQGFMGSGDIDFMTSPNGYFALKFFSLALVLFSAYAVMCGLAVTANDEDAGIFDSFLSLPVPRWAVMTERALAYAVLMLGVLVLTFIGVLIGSALVPQVSYDLGMIGVSMANMFPAMLFVLGVTILFGVLFRRRSTAVGVTIAVIATSYFLNFIASGAPDSPLALAGLVSYFHWNDGMTVMQSGLEPLNIVLLVVAAGVCLIAALWRFERRDIGL